MTKREEIEKETGRKELTKVIDKEVLKGRHT